MRKIILLCLIFLSSRVYSAELECGIQLNQEILSTSILTTTMNQKSSIDSIAGIYAYATEKEKGDFILEAYLVDYELRIYSEGFLRNSSNKLVLSAWGRESIIDIECHLAKE